MAIRCSVQKLSTVEDCKNYKKKPWFCVTSIKITHNYLDYFKSLQLIAYKIQESNFFGIFFLQKMTKRGQQLKFTPCTYKHKQGFGDTEVLRNIVIRSQIPVLYFLSLCFQLSNVPCHFVYRTISTRPKFVPTVTVSFLAHLSRRLRGGLIVYRSSRRLSICVFTLSNMNISETNGSIATKFYLKHHWGGGKAALCFGQIGSELWFPCQQKAPIGL